MGKPRKFHASTANRVARRIGSIVVYKGRRAKITDAITFLDAGRYYRIELLDTGKVMDVPARKVRSA